MDDWVTKLLDLQDKDLRIAKLEEQVRSAPAEKKRVGRILEDAEAAVADVKKTRQVQQTRLKELEIEAETLRAKMRDFQSKSALIKNNDEYRAAMAQIDGCRAQISEIEDRELAVMEELELSRADLQQCGKERDAAKARVVEMLADIDARVASSTTQLEKLCGERDPVAAGISAEILQRYERLRKNSRRKLSDARAFVPIRDNVCDGCHMNVTAQTRMNARKGVMVSCEMCGALLYWEE